MGLSNETETLVGIMFFLTFVGFISAFLPIQFQLLTPFNYVFLTGQIFGIAAACVITTGLPCAAVLIAAFLVNVLAIFLSLQTVIQTLIITPVSIVVIYILMRLAKGGG